MSKMFVKVDTDKFKLIYDSSSESDLLINALNLVNKTDRTDFIILEDNNLIDSNNTVYFTAKELEKYDRKVVSIVQVDKKSDDNPTKAEQAS